MKVRNLVIAGAVALGIAGIVGTGATIWAAGAGASAPVEKPCADFARAIDADLTLQVEMVAMKDAGQDIEAISDRWQDMLTRTAELHVAAPASCEPLDDLHGKLTQARYHHTADVEPLQAEWEAALRNAV